MLSNTTPSRGGLTRPRAQGRLCWCVALRMQPLVIRVRPCRHPHALQTPIFLSKCWRFTRCAWTDAHCEVSRRTQGDSWRTIATVIGSWTDMIVTVLGSLQLCRTLHSSVSESSHSRRCRVATRHRWRSLEWARSLQRSSCR